MRPFSCPDPATDFKPAGFAGFHAGTDRTAIEYRDNGLACDPFSVPSYDLDLPVEQRPIQGLGIHLIRKMSDHIAYGWKDGWNCLRLEKLTRGAKECPKLSVE
jgi:anti-sigma regulatory factor (Ser/Thr protein kinase)